MQIQLKQSEIEAALKDYISKQGIKLQGRTVEIEFTSGRKENGITADLSISDTAGDLPDFPDEQVQPAPTVSLVRSAPTSEDDPVDSDTPQSVLNEDTQPVDEDPPAAPKTSSLFGG